ncbi:MAG: ATP-binding cassette domain-containing protein [Rhodoferax sp.]|nr:ATP-binding cassette domain-containing protein [Rhodoferax sp.]
MKQQRADQLLPVPVLEATGLHFAWAQPPLFAGWSGRFLPGVTLLSGEEGSGKTTLLRLLAGDLVASGGQLQVGSTRLDRDPDGYRAQVFWADPRLSLYDQMTVDACLAMVAARFRSFDGKAVHGLLSGLSLLEHRHKPLFMLSTGSRRKVWLAAAFACGASVILLDEPFAALDRPSIAFITQQLQVAAVAAQRVVVLADYLAPPAVPLVSSLQLG